MRVIVAGGGTGGHLFPGIAVARALRDQHGAEILFLGSEHGIEKRAVPAAGFAVELSPVRGLRGKSPAALVRGLRDLVRGLLAARRAVARFAPDLAIGVGGYAAFPAVLAAALRRTPIVLLEQNAEPGLTNRLLARFATSICASFEGTRAALGPRTVVTGNPIRFAPQTRSATAAEAATSEGSSTAPLRLLVFGGSAGARRLNQVLPAAIAHAAAPISVLHQSGAAEEEATRARYAAAAVPADVKAFIDDMQAAYADADLVICRAGASTIAELTVLGKPAIYVPYPFATGDHQTSNARPLADAEAGWLIADSALEPEGLAELLDALALDRERLRRAGIEARKFGRPDALRDVVAVCLAACGEGV